MWLVGEGKAYKYSEAWEQRPSFSCLEVSPVLEALPTGQRGEEGEKSQQSNSALRSQLGLAEDAPEQESA